MIRAFHSIRLAALALPVLLAGCVAAGDVRPYPPMAAIQPVVAAPAHASPGAIYQAGGASGLSLFADKRAREGSGSMPWPRSQSRSNSVSA